MRVNATFLRWTGYAREDLVGVKRFQDLLTAGGRIYHETHYAPLLRMQGSVREIAVDIVCADGRRLPVLVNSVLLTRRGGRAADGAHDASSTRPSASSTSASCWRLRNRERAAREHAERLHEQTATSRTRCSRACSAARRPTTRASASRRSTSPAVEALEVGGDWHDAFALPRRPGSGSWSATSSAAACRPRPRWASCAAPSRALAGAGLGPRR